MLAAGGSGLGGTWSWWFGALGADSSRRFYERFLTETS